MKKLVLSCLAFALAAVWGGSTAQAATTLTLKTSASTVALGGTLTLTATVSGTSNTGLTWSVNGVTKGNSSTGLLTGSGLKRTYTAPAVNCPNPNPVTFKIVSAADSAISATATATVTSTIVVTISPTSKSLALGGTQLFTATISNTTDKALNWYVNGVPNGNSTQGTLAACTTVAPLTCKYTAPPVNVPSPNPAVIKVASVADPSKFKTASVTVTDTIAVTLSPSSKSLALGGTQLFTATISNTTDKALNWYVNGVLNGNSRQGTLTGTGLTRTYTASATTVPNPDPAVIKVASVADPSKFKTASVTVNAPFATIQISPSSVAFSPTQTAQFTATALDDVGNPVSGVHFTWNSTETSVATISSAGLAKGVVIGTSIITAAADGITSNAAPLMVVSPGFLFTPDDNVTKASVANGPSGDVDIVWSGPNSNLIGDTGAFFVRSTDGGKSFPTPVAVPDSDSPGYQPAVAVAPNGTVYLFWNSGAATTPLWGNIAMSATSDGGTVWSTPVNVTDFQQSTFGSDADAQEDPKVYVDSAGNINMVTTLSRSLSDASFDVIYSRSTNGGASFSAPIVVFDNFNLTGYNVATGPAVLSSGSDVYVAWGESPNTGSTVVEFSHSTNGGASWSAPLVLGDQEGGCSANTCVRLGIDRSGVITAVWGGADADGVFFARSTDGGKSFTARAQIPNTTYDDLNPYAVVDASGTIYVAWERIPPDAPGIQADIYFSRSTDGGDTWSFPVDITNTPSQNSITANVAVDTNQNINLVWMEFVAATFPTPEVAYRRAK